MTLKESENKKTFLPEIMNSLMSVETAIYIP